MLLSIGGAILQASSLGFSVVVSCLTMFSLFIWFDNGSQNKSGRTALRHTPIKTKSEQLYTPADYYYYMIISL